jgi:hypothetical protein
MIDKAKEIALLVLKFVKDELREEENGKLQEWIAASEQNQLVFDELTNELSLRVAITEFYEFQQSIEEMDRTGMEDCAREVGGPGMVQRTCRSMEVGT